MCMAEKLPECQPYLAECTKSAFAVPLRQAPAWRQRLQRRANLAVGAALAVNFVVFWAVPIFVQGQAFHLGLKHVLVPVYNALDRSAALRRFAAAYVYSRPQYADFAATALLTCASSLGALGYALHYQRAHGCLPWQLVAAYNFLWVGFGGRTMGAAYTFAHKEGHNPLIFQRWLRRSFGNIFENWIGCLFGNVPYNFTTSHMHMHHQLDGGPGDSFYQWDLDRTSRHDFLLFVHRIFVHMTGCAPDRPPRPPAAPAARPHPPARRPRLTRLVAALAGTRRSVISRHTVCGRSSVCCAAAASRTGWRSPSCSAS